MFFMSSCDYLPRVVASWRHGIKRLALIAFIGDGLAAPASGPAA